MQLANLVGRRLVVGYALLSQFQVEVTKSNGQSVLQISGMIMESVKVYQDIQVSIDKQIITITVFSSLMFWNRAGSPDFRVSYPVNVPSGTYRIQYSDQTAQPTFVKSIEI